MRLRVVLAVLLFGYALFTFSFLQAINREAVKIDENYQKIANLAPPYAAIVKIKKAGWGLTVPTWRWLETGEKWALVSSAYPISQSYTPTTLEKLKIPYGEWIIDSRLAKIANSSLALLARDASKAGFKVIVTSSYRSSHDQQRLLESSRVNYGNNWAAEYVAKPGESEHQLGLAADLSSYSEACRQTFSSCYLKPATAKWLEEHAHEYGFILRYPADKIAITGIAHEPWHFRYVGKRLATFAKTHHLTLDEILPDVLEQKP